MKTRYIAVTAMLVGVLLTSCWTWGSDAASDRKVLQVMSETVISFSFQEQPVEQVTEYLSTVGNINIVLDKAKVPAGQTVTLKLKDVTLGTAIKLVTEAMGMKYVVRDGVVLISDAEGTKEEPVTRVYDVLDIVTEVPDFPGPTVELGQVGGNSQNGNGNNGNNQGLFGAQPAAGAGGTTTSDQGKSLQERTDALVELIKQVIAPGTWEGGGY